MTTEVIDKLGRKVMRPNGVLQDGDRMSVSIRMMDSNPDLLHAANLADQARRNEAFDARGVQHRPGFAMSDVYDSADKARVARDQRLQDRWKTAPHVATMTIEKQDHKPAIIEPTAPLAELQAAREHAVSSRDKRLENAWRGK
jgi:hypothetical protein